MTRFNIFDRTGRLVSQAASRNAALLAALKVGGWARDPQNVRVQP